MFPLRDLNPRRRRPVVTWCLLGANVLVFLYELALGPQLEGFLMAAAFVPARLSGPAGIDPQLAPALLSMFLHGGFAHVGGNMLFLWIFGDNVEDRLGHLRFLLFYLLCGLAASYAHALANPASAVPAIGASGAISGVLGAYLVSFPRARIVTLVFFGFLVDTVEIPAILYLPLWFLIQLVSGVAAISAPAAGGGVAWFAHIGGFVAGPLLLWGLLPRRPRSRPHARA